MGRKTPWETIEVSHPDFPNPDVKVPVRWKRREWGGWDLVHAETGRVLGWIVRNSNHPRKWDVRLCSSAFRGESMADRGDVLDRVPPRLYDGTSADSFISLIHSTVSDRWDAAFNIVWTLVNRRAPAVGFPRHPEVDTSRSDRYREAMAR